MCTKVYFHYKRHLLSLLCLFISLFSHFIGVLQSGKYPSVVFIKPPVGRFVVKKVIMYDSLYFKMYLKVNKYI